MKSKQLNFFITPEDKKRINTFFVENECCIITDNIIEENKIDCYNLLQLNNDVFQIYVTKKDFFKKITTLSTDNNIKYYDNLTSYILQFSLGGFYPYNKNLLQRGRFYYVLGYYDDNGNFIDKSDNFINWSDSIIKKFKHEFLVKYSKDKSTLYSESAIKWIEINNANIINAGQQWSCESG